MVFIGTKFKAGNIVRDKIDMAFYIIRLCMSLMSRNIEKYCIFKAGRKVIHQLFQEIINSYCYSKIDLKYLISSETITCLKQNLTNVSKNVFRENKGHAKHFINGFFCLYILKKNKL